MKYIKQLTKKQILYLILIVAWMAVVFAFSNQPAEESSQTSGGITEKVVRIIVKEPEKVPQETIDIIETVIRKLAHFTIYSIGGFLIVSFMNTTNMTNKQKIIYSIIVAIIYACTDEIHQFFVEGRSCELRDVIIDSMGASTGVGVFILGKKILRRN